MMCRKPRIAIVLLVAMAFGAMVAQAENAGGPVVPGQPPLSKTVIVGDYVKDPDLIKPSKPQTFGTEFAASAPGYYAINLAHDVLVKGGNFFDASVPFMWGVMFGGDQFFGQTAIPSMYNAKEHRASAHLGMGTNPALLTLDFVRNVLKLQFPPEETTVLPGQQPGAGSWVRAGVIPAPDTMVAILDRYGTMSWKQSTKGTYDMFKNGFPMYVEWISSARAQFTNKSKMNWPIYTEDRAYWGQGGPNPKDGAKFYRPGVSRLIKEMADAEDAALAKGASRSEALMAARDEFYMGNFAKTIDQFSRDTGGYTRWSDYASYRGTWVEQEDMHHTTFMGVDFYADSAVSQSPMLIEILNMIECAKDVTGKSLLEMGYMTADYISYLTQCFNLAAADRWQYYGDPAFVDFPKNLDTKEYAKLRASLINLNKMFKRVPPPGDPYKMKATLDGWKEWTLPPKVSGAPQQIDLAMIPDESLMDTCHGGMIDAAGNVFSYTPSDPGPLVPGYQVRITARNRQFTYDPALPSCIAPGKRPETTPHSWVAVKDGEGFMECQSSGGDDQVPGTIQTVLNYLLWGMSPQVAIEQPRFSTGNQISWFTPHIEGQYDPGAVDLPRVVSTQTAKLVSMDYPPKALQDALTARGAKVGVGGYPNIGLGQTLSVRDPASKMLFTSSTPFPDKHSVSWAW